MAEATFCCSKSVSKHWLFSAMAETKILLAMSATGNVEGVKEALQRGGDPNKISEIGRTALHAAASKGHQEVVAVLLEHPGVDPNVCDHGGRSALHFAVGGDHFKVVTLLLQQLLKYHLGSCMHSVYFKASLQCTDIGKYIQPAITDISTLLKLLKFKNK